MHFCRFIYLLIIPSCSFPSFPFSPIYLPLVPFVTLFMSFLSFFFFSPSLFSFSFLLPLFLFHSLSFLCFYSVILQVPHIMSLMLIVKNDRNLRWRPSTFV